jgi:hypothetical protein
LSGFGATVGRALGGTIGAPVVLTRGRSAIGRAFGGAVGSAVVLTRGGPAVGRALGSTIGAPVAARGVGATVGRTLAGSAAARPDVIVVESHRAPSDLSPHLPRGEAPCTGWYPVHDHP